MPSDKLTAVQVKQAKPKPKPYKLADGKGLYLLVNPSGTRWWRLAYRYGGKQKTISMGTFPDTSLADARQNREAARKLLRDGIDPSAARQVEKEMQTRAAQDTFGAVAAEWLAKNESSWSDSTIKQNKSRLRRDILPYLGKRPIAEIHAADILQVAQRVAERGAHDLARRVLRIMKQVCQFGLITRRLQDNPAVGLSGALPTAKVRHMSAMTDPEAVAGLLRAIEGYEGEPITRAALKLAPLVFVRPGELRHAQWSEIDLEAGRWSIPGKRTKMGTDLIVPLSTQAVEILTELEPLTGRADYVFHSARSMTRPISNNTLNAALRRMGFTKDEMTAHGFRAMARTLLDEKLQVRVDYVEQQLGHKVVDPNGRSYNRTKHLPERTEMMQAWSDYLDGLRAARV